MATAFNDTTLYTSGGSRYQLAISASGGSGSVTATAALTPITSGAYFSSNHTGYLSVSISGGLGSNSYAPYTCSANSPASISVTGYGTGTFTITATWNYGSEQGAKPGNGSISTTIYVDSGVTYRTFSFNMNGHGNQISSQSVVNGQKATRPSPDPTADGYSFVNWYTDNTLTTVYDFNTAVTSNKTVYAKWVENGVLRVYKSGEWKKATPYQWISGAWKQEKAMIFKNGEWKRGI